MSDAPAWLADRAASAPGQLVERMAAALRACSAATIHDHIAEAGAIALASALRTESRRERALDLLTADALFTHACEAAAEQGGRTLADFAARWNAARFDQILNTGP